MAHFIPSSHHSIPENPIITMRNPITSVSRPLSLSITLKFSRAAFRLGRLVRWRFNQYC